MVLGGFRSFHVLVTTFLLYPAKFLKMILAKFAAKSGKGPKGRFFVSGKAKNPTN